MSIFGNLKIQRKLAVLCSAFLIPIAFLVYLFVAQTEKDIVFAAKEIEGVGYFSVLRTELSNLAALAHGLGSSAQTGKALAAVRDTDMAKAAEMGATASADRAADAVRAAIGLAADSPPAAYDEALGAVIDHIRKVQDNSNLTLDPDLDSYYTQDLVTVKMPAVVMAANRMVAAALHLVDNPNPTPAQLAAYLTRRGEFVAAMGALNDDIMLGEHGNTDQTLKPAIDGPSAELVSKAAALTTLLDTLQSSKAEKPKAAAIRESYGALLSAADDLWDVADRALEHLLQARIDGFHGKMAISLGLTLLVLLLSIFAAWQIARSIDRPIAALVTAMERMAAADLSTALPAWSRRDEIGLLARAADAMRKHLQALVSDVHQHAQTVREATQKIAGAVDAEAATSSEMSASVAEITSTMEEFSASSSQIAEHAKAVADNANLTWENAKSGVEAMQQLSARITDIRDDNALSLNEIIDLGGKSKEISQVMKIINTIADQTKLIAFNAALEASSAGEAGQRFGVVASEIRRLADSVTESTGEIETKVEHIQGAIQRLVISSEKGAGNITAGMAAATGTAEQLNQLVAAAQRTANAAKQISLSTQQQKSASAQVVVALREIVSASAQTARSITHISETGKHLMVMTSDLDTQTGRFRLE